MTEIDCFMLAILTTPDDDLPRLVFADWLEEHGDGDRAEFIRCQVELARTATCGRCKLAATVKGWGVAVPKCAEHDALRERERALLTAHWREWIGETISELVGTPAYRYEVPFRRGFPAELTMSSADWLTHCDALFWSPGQTEACPECHGYGMIEYRDKDNAIDHYLCSSCADGRTGYRRGSGRVPRPFVSGAQPLTDIHLTTEPEGWSGLVFRDSPGSEPATKVRHEHYPGLTFHLPEQPPATEEEEPDDQQQWTNYRVENFDPFFLR